MISQVEGSLHNRADSCSSHPESCGCEKFSDCSISVCYVFFSPAANPGQKATGA